MTTSQRASSLVKSIPVDQNDRDQLREQWRLAAVASVDADDKASRAKEGKPIFFAALVETLVQQNEGSLSSAKAERMAMTSAAYKEYLDEMHNLRHAARLLEVAEKNADRLYWEHVSQEAQSRAEMRMR